MNFLHEAGFPVWFVIAFVGVKEALCNLDVACAFGITASLVATVGRRRDAVASAG